MEESKVLRAITMMHSAFTSLNLKRTDFGLLKNLLGKLPWDKDLGGREAQEILMFKDHSKIRNNESQ